MLASNSALLSQENSYLIKSLPIMNFRRSLVSMLALLCIQLPGLAQDSQEQDSLRPVAVFAELGGGSSGFTLNIEKTLFKVKRTWFINARIGGGSYRIRNGQARFTSVPAGVSMHHGSRRHHPEIALTFSYVEGTAWSDANTEEFGKSFYLTPGVGYRYQKPGTSFFLKAQYVLLIKVKEFDPYWADTTGKAFHLGGICIGFSFQPRNR